jgi:hypothetical protein
MFSELDIRTQLTLANYNRWLRTFYSDRKENNDWSESYVSCGNHAAFVIEQLGFPVKDFGESNEVNEDTIDDIIKHLDKGHLVDLLHDYKDRMIFSRLPEDNRYGNHEFQIIKGGDKYFVVQGFLYAYKHSLIAYSKDEIRDMLHNIITNLSDYENKKVWGDLDLDMFKRYFRTELFMYPTLPVLKHRLVHNVVLTYDVFIKGL